MGKTSPRDTQRLLNNANKTVEKLTEEAKEARIVELQVELAKRQEQIGSLEERVFGLLKCIGSLEVDVMNKDKDPKERNYVSLHVNQHHLVEVKRNQDELSEVVKNCCQKINQLTDYLKAFKGLEYDSEGQSAGRTQTGMIDTEQIQTAGSLKKMSENDETKVDEKDKKSPG